MEHKQRLVWISRFLIGLVLFFNVQCALVFLISPANFAPGFELQGVVGDSMVRAMGILFLMWNVPYVIAVMHPVRRRISLYEALVMQAIGLIGETVLLVTFPAGHPVLRETVGRFIFFDGAGLGFLLIALILTIRQPSRSAA